MTEENPFDDSTTSHPLDLLINAISGSTDDNHNQNQSDHGGYRAAQIDFDLEGLLASSAAEEENNKPSQDALGRDVTSPLSPRQVRTAKTLFNHLTRQISSDNAGEGSSSAFSTVELWHPTIGQKSYGKERRLLNPPPILRVSGPLLPLLTSATLSAVVPDTQIPALSTQTHRIPLTYISDEPEAQAGTKPSAGRSTKRLLDTAMRSGFGTTLPSERTKIVAWERDALKEGLSFPGLYIGQEVERTKEFELHLSLGQPGAEVETKTVQLPRPAKRARRTKVQPEGDVPAVPANEGAPVKGAAQVAPAVEVGAIVTENEDIRLDELPVPSEDLIDPELREYLTSDPVSSTEIPATLVEHLEAGDLPAATETDVTSSAPVQPSTESNNPDIPADPTVAASTTSAPWVTFRSSPLDVVSKPSQKTAKARSMDNCLSPDDTFCLWVRINSQTVRTKFMKVEKGETPRLTSRTGQWTPFKFEIIRLEPLADTDAAKYKYGKSTVADYTGRVLTYGSLGVLVDMHSGNRSEPMIIVHVERGFVNYAKGMDDTGHPVNELQRVGFVRVNGDTPDETGGSRWYLSAPGARLGGGEMHDKPAVDQDGGTKAADSPAIGETTGAEIVATTSTDQPVRKRKKTKRYALAQAVVAEGDEGGSKSWLTWHKVERLEREVWNLNTSMLNPYDVVEDWNSWVIGGVSSSTYSFLDTKTGSGLPSHLEPIPRVLADPQYSSSQNTTDLVLSDFYSTDQEGRTEPLQVYFGPIGPLPTSTWRSTATSSRRGDAKQLSEAVPYDEVNPPVGTHPPLSAFSSTIPHILVVVSMPAPELILRTMQECVARSKQGGENTQPDANASHPWYTGAAEADTNEASFQQMVDSSTNDTAAQNGSKPTISSDHSAQTANDSDIAAVLSAHMGQDFLFSNSDGLQNATLDPTLFDVAATNDAQAQTLADVGQDPSNQDQTISSQSHLGQGSDNDLIAGHAEVNNPSPAIALEDKPVQVMMPPKDETKSDMIPLPMVLIRKSDGVGFGVGKSIEAVKLNRGVDEPPRWGLRLVNSK